MLVPSFSIQVVFVGPLFQLYSGSIFSLSIEVLFDSFRRLFGAVSRDLIACPKPLAYKGYCRLKSSKFQDPFSQTRTLVIVFAMFSM